MSREDAVAVGLACASCGTPQARGSECAVEVGAEGALGHYGSRFDLDAFSWTGERPAWAADGWNCDSCAEALIDGGLLGERRALEKA